MKYIVAKTAGFCFGVRRAMDIAAQIAAEQKEPVYTFGPLIHNEQAVERLREQGIVPLDKVEDIPENSTLIIRTHGITPQTQQEILKRTEHIVDATCPFVKKIHRIVQEHDEKGYQIVIAGDPTHPEVIGISGWCKKESIVIETPEQLQHISSPFPLCFVSQTTFSSVIWEKIKKNAKTACKSAVFFDTICSATDQRQKEAKEIASKADIMIVIGGRHSSNTKKLVDICSGCCPETYHIETLSQLPKLGKGTIGVTAGASTPEWIIKEVLDSMTEEKMVAGTEEMTFAEALEQSLVSLKSRDIVKGTVIGITPTEVFVNLGSKQDGIIPAGELSEDPTVAPEDIVKIGDEIEVFVVRVNDVEGTITLSKKKVDAMAGYKKLEEAMETKEVLKGKVVEAVNGGVIVLSNGSRVFVPASQASVRFVQDLGALVGDEVSFRVIDVNPRRRKLVGSIKSVAAQERKEKLEKFWESAEVGKEYEGVVKSLTDFGAFVDIGGIDGLIHISELSWSRVKHPSEVVNVGDTVSVYIIGLDREKNKVSLGYRRQADNPWEIARNKINVGDVVNVKIVRIAAFGAFAEILPHVDGLIHISQISNERIAKVADALSIGQQVDAKVVEADFDAQKISLSIRALLEPEPKAEEIPEETMEIAAEFDTAAPEKAETAEAEEE